MEAIGAWLVIIAVALGVIGIFGHMNNYNNRYPVYFIAIALVLGLIAEFMT